jgi:hypothetical protein
MTYDHDDPAHIYGPDNPSGCDKFYCLNRFAVAWEVEAKHHAKMSTHYRDALERLAKVDPFIVDDLPFVDVGRELQARIEYAEDALTQEVD